MRPDQHVLHQRHVGEEPQILEGAGDAALDDHVGRETGHILAGEPHLAAIGLDEAGDQVEEGGLAGAVRPDNADDRARHDVEVDPSHRLNAAEGFP